MARKNKTAVNLDCSVLNVFFGLVKSDILFDFLFYKHLKDLDTFIDKWFYSDLLCERWGGGVFVDFEAV